MNELDYIEKYYNEEFNITSEPFNSLSKKDIEDIEGCISYGYWRLDQEKLKIKTLLDEEIKRRIRNYKINRIME